MGEDDRREDEVTVDVGDEGQSEVDPFAVALRRAIERSGLSLTAISQRLRARRRPVSVATLSNWQSGRSLPGGEQSLGVLAALEDMLGREPDSLTGLVGAPRPRGRSVQPARFLGAQASRAIFRDALRELGFDSAEQYAQERVVHLFTVVDSDRDVQTVEYRIAVRALETGISRLPAVQLLGEDEPNEVPRCVPLTGCSIGRRVTWPEHRTYGAEMVLDGPLDAGQVAVFSYRVEFRAAATDLTASMYSVPRRANDVLVEVEFRGDRRPLGCERYRRSDAGEVVSEIRLDRRDRVQLSDARFGPGTFGLRWYWPEADDEDDEDDLDWEDGF